MCSHVLLHSHAFIEVEFDHKVFLGNKIGEKALIKVNRGRNVHLQIKNAKSILERNTCSDTYLFYLLFLYTNTKIVCLSAHLCSWWQLHLGHCFSFFPTCFPLLINPSHYAFAYQHFSLLSSWDVFSLNIFFLDIVTFEVVYNVADGK